MPPPVRIADADDPRIAAYRDVRDADLKRRSGECMAEGRLVVDLVLRGSTRVRARSVLVTEPALAAIEPALEVARASAERESGDVPPVFVATRAVMDAIVGFPIHRGCLAACARPAPMRVDELVELANVGESGGERGGPALFVGLEGIANHDNVGSIFRSAAAFGVAGVALCARSCDPLYRKAIRVSMGHSLRLPFARAEAGENLAQALAAAGATTAALVTDADATPIDRAGELLDGCDRLALLVGAEGSGLARRTVAACAHRLRIAMAPGVDSLNVGVAAAIALQRAAEARRLGSSDG
jgi:tRNA G18 (ribose-2'-O)-methylase SpoU